MLDVGCSLLDVFFGPCPGPKYSISLNTTTFAARDFRPRRGASDAHTLSRHVGIRREQRRLGRKEPPPAGLRRFSVLALLLVGHPDRSGRGCSLVAPSQHRNATQQTWSYLWNGVLSGGSKRDTPPTVPARR